MDPINLGANNAAVSNWYNNVNAKTVSGPKPKAPTPSTSASSEASSQVGPSEVCSFSQDINSLQQDHKSHSVNFASFKSSAPDFSFDLDSQESLSRMEELRKGGLADELRGMRKDLKVQRKELRENGTVAQKAELHSQLKDVDSAIKGIEKSHRALNWNKVESGVTGEVSPIFKSYYVNGETPIEEMKQVISTAQDLADPNSERRLKGNDVKPLVRQEIWQTKMQKLENAAQNPTVDGKPVEINAEYYELASPDMLEKLSRASKGGADVKVLMDPGQISRMSGTPDATSMASRLNTIRRLEEGSGGKAAVQLFANSEVLGGRDEIMHRKLLRVGDDVVFGGMNANDGSGENVDFGMSIKGQAAGKFVDIFKQDVELSRGRTSEQIYGKHMEDLRGTGDVVLQPRGVVDLLEAQIPGGPKTGESFSQRAQRVMDNAAYQGLSPSELVEIPDKDGDGVVSSSEERSWVMAGKGEAKLTEKGRALLADGLDSAINRMNSKNNQDSLQSISQPNCSKQGEETVAIGNSSVERQAMVLHAIDSAQEYIKVSSFVLNEDLARLLVEKKDSMESQNKPFNVQVVLDPGVYGYGGSPNESAYKLLEDNGVDVRWAALDRSTPDHDRKVHAKLMLTDQMMLGGSTNFSSKGLRDNWELSDITFFNDPQSRQDQEKVNKDFQQLWERESLDIDTIAIAEKKHGTLPGPEGEYLRDSERTTATRRFLRGISNLEKSIGKDVQDLTMSDPGLSFQIEQKVKQGHSEGYASLEALGPERLSQIRYNSEAWSTLQNIRSGDY